MGRRGGRGEWRRERVEGGLGWNRKHNFTGVFSKLFRSLSNNRWDGGMFLVKCINLPSIKMFKPNANSLYW